MALPFILGPHQCALTRGPEGYPQVEVTLRLRLPIAEFLDALLLSVPELQGPTARPPWKGPDCEGTPKTKAAPSSCAGKGNSRGPGARSKVPPAVKESHAGANLPWGGESAGLLTSLSVGGEMSRWKSSLLPVAFVHEANSGLLSASHVVSRFRGAHRREQQKLPRAQHQWRMDHTKKPQPMITASSPNDHGSASPPRPAKIAPSSPSCAPVAPMCPSSSQRPSPETKTLQAKSVPKLQKRALFLSLPPNPR